MFEGFLAVRMDLTNIFEGFLAVRMDVKKVFVNGFLVFVTIFLHGGVAGVP